MSAATAVHVVNRLIEGLPRKIRDRLVENCEPVDLEFGDILCERNQGYKHVYFPLTGIVSLVAMVRGHPPLEMGLIGNEGMLGVQRSAVTIAAGALHRGKLIRYTRGEISVLNRRGLEAASCECYQAVVEDYKLLFA